MKRTFAIVVLLVALGCRKETSSTEAPAAEPTQPPPVQSSQPPGPVGQEQKFPALGAAIPSFELKDLDGKATDLAALKGKVVLVNLWATWCGPCRAEIPGFIEMYGREKANGLEIIGISVDSEGSERTIRAFMEDQKIDYPVLFDPEGKSTELFETSVIPTSALLDRNGRVVWFNRGAFEPADPDFSRALASALKG